ncbi:MAG: hypothetical protein ACJ0NI_01620 [Flavobacteriaceae bacterium]
MPAIITAIVSVLVLEISYSEIHSSNFCLVSLSDQYLSERSIFSFVNQGFLSEASDIFTFNFIVHSLSFPDR